MTRPQAKTSTKRLPTRAQVKMLSTEELIEKTRILSAERWRAIYAGQPKRGNRMYDTLIALEKELRARGVDAQRQLLKLLEDPDHGTRCWVAAAVLDFAPKEGVRVLTEIAAIPNNGLVGFSAEWALKQWKEGIFHPP